ncbi:defensin-like protein 1 [Sesamum indicum]|uniref:Defensin-like protein 1 n=1 Tax=Sesamum indicum TaxID=4182 RepID=A0A6I9TLI9_SESIN|nr:defensin-like protein 1 [Sesamum indicum]
MGVFQRQESIMGTKVFFSLLLLLLLLFTTHEEVGFDSMIVKADGRTCLSQSHGFRGQCWSNTNCRLVCRNEGFPGGRCRGFRRRCFCVRPCP